MTDELDSPYIFGAANIAFALKDETEEVRAEVFKAIRALVLNPKGNNVRPARGRQALIEEEEYGYKLFHAELPHGFYLSFVLGRRMAPIGHEIVCRGMLRLPPGPLAP